MGSLVEYRCQACGYTAGPLKVGWGKAGRAAFWGGLAMCATCKDLVMVDLADPRVERRADRRCATCNTALKLLEGTVDSIRCPRCTASLHHKTAGTWS